MPRRSVQNLPAWAKFILSEYSPGQLQGGINTAAYIKRGQRRTSPVIKVARKVSGTGIPASTFSRLTPQSKISEITIRKLRRFYNRVQYARLRQAGASPWEARSIYRRRPKSIADLVLRYGKAVDAISKEKNVPREAVLFGVSRSEKTVSELEEMYPSEIEL